MRFIPFLVVLSFLSCERPPDDEKIYDLVDSTYAAVSSRGLQFYLNSERAGIYRKLSENSNGSAYVQNRFWYCKELLNAGLPGKAIEEIELLMAHESTAQADSEWLWEIRKLRAVGYLRAGEEANCLDGHVANSCVIPIQQDGVYKITDFTIEAIAILESLLKEKQETELVWLLNIAYMTVGKYPDDVPDQYRISEQVFADNNPLERFDNIAPALGVNTNGLAGGSAFDDFTGNGYIDIVASSSGFNDPLTFYVNDSGVFRDESVSSNLHLSKGGLNLNHTDINNDGLPDLFLMRGGWFGEDGRQPNSILVNQGDGTFKDETISRGLLSFSPTQTSSWADFDLDGNVDLFVGNESLHKNHPSILYGNNKGKFSNSNEETQMDINNFVKGVAWGDVNNDGYPDLYISIMGGFNRLLLNTRDSDGSVYFKDISVDAGVTDPFVSFPIWFFDYNNDGWEDIFVIGYTSSNRSLAEEVAYELIEDSARAALPVLYRNNGDMTFEDVTSEVGLDNVVYGMGSNYGDFDNDGFLDILIGTGDPELKNIIPNRAFRNVNGEYFEEVTYSGGFSNIQKGHGVSFADVDNDGDEDIYCTMGGQHEGDIYPNILYQNPHSDRNWVVVKLVGKQANRLAIGARVKLTVSGSGGSTTIYRTVSGGGSFGSSSFRLEIGLGEYTSIDEMEVRWPSGKEPVSLFTNLPVKQHLTITQGDDEVKREEMKPLVLTGDAALNHNH